MGKSRFSKRQRKQPRKKYLDYHSVKVGIAGHTTEGVKYAGFARPKTEWGTPIPEGEVSIERASALQRKENKKTTVHERILEILERHVTFQIAQNDTVQAVQTFNRVAIRGGKHYKLWMYFSGEQYFFLEEDAIENRMRLSRKYRGRDLAMQADRLGINWIQSINLDDE
jgi:hypothetical protein